MDNYLKVEGNDDLVRDKRSRAIINTNDKALRQSQDRRKKLLAKEAKIEQLEKDVQEIKDTMSKILSHLEKK